MILIRMKKVSSAVVPIIRIDREAPKSLQRQVYEGFRAAILSGTLRPGQRVPSTRVLGSELGISRIPALNAYAQLLAEGYFQSRVGAGTRVSPSIANQGALSKSRSFGPATRRRGPRRPAKHVLHRYLIENAPWPRGWGAFGIGQVALDQFPFQVWNGLITRHSRNARVKSFHYGNPFGSKDLREAIAVYLRTARDVHCEAEQIMIVCGSQQALQISAQVLLNEGDPVWMEEPGYRLARSVFTLNGSPIVPVPVDHEGLNVAAGIKRCPKARLALVTPSHQFPLGVTMSASRRLQLLDWAESSGSWILEDDYDSEFRYDTMPISSLEGLDGNSRVLYIGTLSKTLFPSLRLGYVVIPFDLIDHFSAVRVAMDIGPPAFLQGVVADFIREGHFSRHIRRMRSLYRERQRALIDSIGKELGPGGEITGEQAGMHLCLLLNGIDDREVASRAARHHLWLVPLSSSYLSRIRRQGFILGFGSTAVEKIADAVSKLGALLVSDVHSGLPRASAPRAS